MRSLSRYTLVLTLLLSLTLLPGLSQGLGGPTLTQDDSRYESLLAHLVRMQFEARHFSQRKFDDNLSKAAFELYLKQLDPRKVFLLAEDVEKLKKYSGLISEEIRSGKMELPLVGMNLLKERVARVQPMLREVLSKDLDLSHEEVLETDPEKLSFCKTEEELKERWRKFLVLQVVYSYLSLEEDEAAAKKGSDEKVPEGKTEDVKKSSPGSLQKTAREKVLKSYDESLSRMLKEKQSEYFERYFSAVAKALDPHSEYMAPVEKEDFDIGMKGSLEGIGAMLREEDGYVRIESVIPGGPAARQGRLHASDRILKVAEGSGEPIDIVGMKVRDAVKLIRGKKGTEVRLTVRKEDGSQVVVPIVRDVVQIEETFAKGTTLKDGKTEKVFGYITLPSFYRDFENTRNGGRGRNSTDDVRSELKKLQAEHVEGLILDLRNNGGGALTDAIGIAGLFIGGGPVVQVKSGRGDIKVLADEDDVRPSFNGPLVVLVNKFSASASEILSGVLQDYGRAVIVGGNHTFGKGTVQTLIDLDESVSFENAFRYRPFGALRITIQKFYRATGESTQYKGVVPDIILPDPLDSGKVGEEFLEYALPWDRIKPASFEKWPRTFGDVSVLKARSAGRVRAKDDFVAIQLASEKTSEQQKKTLQSLNLDVVRKEREELHKLKEKLGKNSARLHDAEKKKPADKEMTAEERRNLWVKETGEDPYVQEAVDVLKDMLSEVQKSTVAKEAHVLSHSTTQSAIPVP